jgi:glucose/arabinose dehydrogenase
VEYRSDGTRADPSSDRELLIIDKTQGVKWHNGGQLQFGPDGLLYVSMGDSARNFFDGLPNPPRTADPKNNAQNPDLLFGKLLRLDVDARRPKPEIAAYGLRNAWRFSFDRATDDLFIADVGQFEHEEVDFLPNGRFDEQLNFGWSIYEGLEPYNRRHRLATQGGLVWPVLTYEHGAGPIYCPGRGSIIGGYVYRGTGIPGLAGRYVFGDYCTGELWSLRIENGAAVDVRKEPESVSSLSSFGEDADGELYATALVDGIVYKLVPAG